MKNGKISETILKRSVIGLIDYKNERVAAGAAIGQGCSVLDTGREYVLSSTECALTGSRLGPYFAVVRAANNIAACCGTPVGALAAFVLSAEFDETRLKTLTRTVLAGCRRCGVQLAGGHTEITGNAACDMTAVTVTGFCSRENYRSVKAVTPGMDIVAAGWIAMEETALLLDQYRGRILERLPESYIAGLEPYTARIQGSGPEFEVCGGTECMISAASAAVRSGAFAMQDMAAGGVFAALWDFAEGAGTGLTVDLKAIPVRQETVEICEIFNINPYQAASAGALLIAAKDGPAMVRRLSGEGIHAAVIGHTTSDHGRKIVNGDEIRFLDKP